MLKICEDGKLIFQEMFSGAFELFYKGLSGYIYHCVGEYEINNNVGVTTTATSKEPVKIMDCEYIEDVYQKIMEYGQKGTFVYERFEELPQWRHDIIRGIVYREIKRQNLIYDKAHPLHSFYKDNFQKYWKEAEVLCKNNLLENNS